MTISGSDQSRHVIYQRHFVCCGPTKFVFHCGVGCLYELTNQLPIMHSTLWKNMYSLVIQLAIAPGPLSKYAPAHLGSMPGPLSKYAQPTWQVCLAYLASAPGLLSKSAPGT